MQRKNYLLKKEGFAVIMAVMVLIVIATIMAFSIQMSAKNDKRAVDIYLLDQAEIFAKNAAEYTVYRISQNKDCSLASIPTFVLHDFYKVDVNISYAFSDPIPGVCTGSGITLQSAGYGDAYGYARIDVSVTVDGNVTAEPIRIYRRYVEDITPYIY